MGEWKVVYARTRMIVRLKRMISEVKDFSSIFNLPLPRRSIRVIMGKWRSDRVSERHRV